MMTRTVIAAYPNELQAEVARGRLQEEGIEASLKDRHVVGINWLYSSAVGGVKVEVDEEDAQEAVEVLSDDHIVVLDEAGESESPPCARCGSHEMVPYQPLKVFQAVTMLTMYIFFLLWPFVTLASLFGIQWKARRRCMNCRSKEESGQSTGDSLI